MSEYILAWILLKRLQVMPSCTHHPLHPIHVPVHDKITERRYSDRKYFSTLLPQCRLLLQSAGSVTGASS
ncbi:MAG: hypothetical protein ACE5I5_14190 [Candidatus Heimdallarchaeota archaeon]